jgi:hypothetical protein
VFHVCVSLPFPQAVWQTRTPAELQGRIFTLQQSLSKMSLPLAALAAGPLNDLVFEPLMQTTHADPPLLLRWYAEYLPSVILSSPEVRVNHSYRALAELDNLAVHQF